jgi:hypothetical protein
MFGDIIHIENPKNNEILLKKLDFDTPALMNLFEALIVANQILILFSGINNIQK